MSSGSEERDALDALKASRRDLEVSVHLEQLLGSGDGPTMEVVRASGREQTGMAAGAGDFPVSADGRGERHGRGERRRRPPRGWR